MLPRGSICPMGDAQAAEPQGRGTEISDFFPPPQKAMKSQKASSGNSSRNNLIHHRNDFVSVIQERRKIVYTTTKSGADVWVFSSMRCRDAGPCPVSGSLPGTPPCTSCPQQSLAARCRSGGGSSALCRWR